MTLATSERLDIPASKSGLSLVRLSIALAFLAGILVFAVYHLSNDSGTVGLLGIAAVIGAYMAMNIGANDVANNIGPTVGSGALTMLGAIGIAAVFEFSGALIAGGDVVGTIKGSIIDPDHIKDPATFTWLMLAALTAAAIWLNIASALGAPVSTTHSIVGGVLGAGIAAAGWQIANWNVVFKIAASWVISPVLGGVIAAIFLYLIMRTITDQRDLVASARRMVPFLIALMAWTFITYLALKGLKKIWTIEFVTAAMIGLAGAIVVYVLVRPIIARTSSRLRNEVDSINALFSVPLIFSAALLSFAHGANDVANAVGPLAAINDALAGGEILTKATIPLWVMLVGAIGIVLGLALYGPKIVRTVGTEITHLDVIRAFCVALSAAITVIVASQLGMPVSSTHIAIGGVVGVGFLREYLNANRARLNAEINTCLQGCDPDKVRAFLDRFNRSVVSEQSVMLKQLKKGGTADLYLERQDRKALRKLHRQDLVKRSTVARIVAAWLITVPASACLAAMLFYMIRGFMLP